MGSKNDGKQSRKGKKAAYSMIALQERKLRRVARRNGVKAASSYAQRHGLPVKTILTDEKRRREARVEISRKELRHRGFIGDRYRLLKAKMKGARNEVQPSA